MLLTCLAIFLSSYPNSIPSQEEIQKMHEFQYQQRLENLKKESKKLVRLLPPQSAEEPIVLNNSAIKKMNARAKAAPKHSVKDQMTLQRMLYKQALGEIRLEHWDNAMFVFEDFTIRYPHSDLADNAIYWMAKVYLKKKEKKLAQIELERLLMEYPLSDRADLARTKLEELNLTVKGVQP